MMTAVKVLSWSLCVRPCCVLPDTARAAQGAPNATETCKVSVVALGACTPESWEGGFLDGG